MNRNIAPQSGDIRMPVVPSYTTTTLPNGLPMHVLRGGAQPIVKIDILVKAGSLRTEQCGVARAVSDLLAEGTVNHTSQEIAKLVDFYGAYLGAASSTVSCTLTLICLSRDIPNVLPLFEEVIKYPTFPQEELDLYKIQELQAFDIEMRKSAKVAMRQMLTSLYGEGSRYARFVSRETIQAMQSEDLLRFHSRTYRPAGAQLFISGQPSDADLRLIAEAFGENWEGGEPWEAPVPEFRSEVTTKFMNFEGNQSSLRLGRKAFSRLDSDFLPMQVANLAFGGYFGSRLMQVLREKMGLTYGINSFLLCNKAHGIMGIGSEIKAGCERKAIATIKDEMDRMCSENISGTELDSVRGVLLGDILRYFDSVSSSASTLLAFLVDDIPVSRVQEYYDIIKNITPDEIREVASRWLQPDKFNIVCVGPGVEE